MKIALVYQDRFANVFEVENFGLTAQERGQTKRLLQHSYSACEWFVRGARAGGAIVEVFGCNKVGDICEKEWTANLDSQPFFEEFGKV